MRKIFKNSELESELNQNGFFVIRGFYDKEEIDFCLKLFGEVDPKLEVNFYSSINSRSVSYRRKVDKIIRDRLTAKVTSLFHNYYPSAFTFIVKRPGTGSEVPNHVDDTHVEEDIFTSINIWSPLVDTTIENGALKVLVGSHKLPYPPRGFGMPSHPYQKYDDLINEKMILLPMKAGDAIVYHSQLIHGSDINNSDKIRPALITGLIPQEATPIIYFQHEELAEGQIEKFQVNHEFWMTFRQDKKPENLKSLAIETYIPASMTEKEFMTFFGWKKPFLTRVREFFS